MSTKPEIPVSLNEDELNRLISRTLHSIHVLKKSGDFPEHREYDIMLRKLTDALYNLTVREPKRT